MIFLKGIKPKKKKKWCLPLGTVSIHYDSKLCKSKDHIYSSLTPCLAEYPNHGYAGCRFLPICSKSIPLCLLLSQCCWTPTRFLLCQLMQLRLYQQRAPEGHFEGKGLVFGVLVLFFQLQWHGGQRAASCAKLACAQPAGSHAGSRARPVEARWGATVWSPTILGPQPPLCRWSPNLIPERSPSLKFLPSLSSFCSLGREAVPSIFYSNIA